MGMREVVQGIQTMMRSIEGIRSAPAVILESNQVFPFAITYPRRGDVDLNAGWTKNVGTIFTEIHCSRTLLEQTLNDSVPFLEKVITAVQNDPSLGGTVSTVVALRWEFGRLVYGLVDTIGYRFEIDVKIM